MPNGRHEFHTILTPKVDLHAYWVDDSDAGYILKPGYSAGAIRINSLRDTIHFTRAGHALVADRLAPALEARLEARGR